MDYNRVMGIRLYGDKILTLKAKEVEGWSEQLGVEMEEIRKTLIENKNGAGLAAPQVGIGKRLFAIKDIKTKEIRILINPKIRKTYGPKVFPVMLDKDGKREKFLEGCLSFPDIYGTVKRYLKIDLDWQEAEGGELRSRSKEAGGFEAIVCQHELDHLEGILLVDRVAESRGKLYRQIGEKMEEELISNFL